MFHRSFPPEEVSPNLPQPQTNPQNSQKTRTLVMWSLYVWGKRLQNTMAHVPRKRWSRPFYVQHGSRVYIDVHCCAPHCLRVYTAAQCPLLLGCCPWFSLVFFSFFLFSTASIVAGYSVHARIISTSAAVQECSLVYTNVYALVRTCLRVAYTSASTFLVDDCLCNCRQRLFQ